LAQGPGCQEAQARRLNTVKEQKTDKDNYIILNRRFKSALDAYLSDGPHPTSITCSKAEGRKLPADHVQVTRLVKSWAEAVGAKGNFGAPHTQEDWTYKQRVVFKTSWEILAHRLNHSSPSITRRYLGVATEKCRNPDEHDSKTKVGPNKAPFHFNSIKRKLYDSQNMRLLRTLSSSRTHRAPHYLQQMLLKKMAKKLNTETQRRS
jgi:hypothetical protein